MMRYWRALPILFKVWTVALAGSVLLICAVICQPCHGANVTCYVSPSGSNTSPYDTWAKAAIQPNTAISYMQGVTPTGTGAGLGHTLYVAPGTYAANMAFSDADLSGTTVTFTTAHGSTTPCTTYEAIVNNPADNTNGITVGSLSDNVTFVGRAVIRCGGTGVPLYIQSGSGSCDNLSITGIDFEQTSTAANHVIYAQNVNGTISKCTFRGSQSGTVYTCRALSGTTLTFNYCISTASRAGTVTGSWYIQSGANITLNNCIHLDSYQHGVNVLSGGTATLNNCIIQGSIQASDGYALNNAGTMNVYNSLLLSGIMPGQYTTGTLTVDSNNISGSNPLFRSNGKKGYLVMRTDDFSSLPYVVSLEPKLAAKGMKGVFYLSAVDLINSPTQASDIATLQGLIRRGTYEIGVHGYSHTAVSYTNALRFTQTGGSNCTVAYDGTTITCNCDGTDYDQTYTATGKNLGEIITALNGQKGWTVAKSTTGSQDADRISSYAKGTSLATCTATSVPMDITFDTSAYNAGFFNDEIYAPIATLKTIINPNDTIIDGQTGVSWTPRTFGCPYNVSSTASRSAAISSGYNAYSANLNGTPVGCFVQDIDLFGIWNKGAPNLKGVSESLTRTYAAGLGIMAANSGAIIEVVGHNIDYAPTEPALTDWDYILDEWSKISGLSVTSTQSMADAIRSNNTDDGDGTFSRTLTIYNDDYHLLGSSPCINTGTDVSLTSDYDGKPVPIGSAPDIGVYEYIPFPGGFPHSIFFHRGR